MPTLVNTIKTMNEKLDDPDGQINLKGFMVRMYVGWRLSVFISGTPNIKIMTPCINLSVFLYYKIHFNP